MASRRTKKTTLTNAEAVPSLFTAAWWCSLWTPFLLLFLLTPPLLLLLLLCGCPAANAQQQQQQPLPLDPETTCVIDGCAKVRGAQEEEKKIFIIVEPQPSGTTATRLHFTDCAIPDDMDITIAVPPRRQQLEAGPHHAVHIEVVHTTMQGGSLEIVPHDDDGTQPPQEPVHQPPLEHIHFTVNHATLRCDGDTLVVNTTGFSSSMAVKDITMDLQDVVLTSSCGSVASVVTDGEKNSAVSRCRIGIGSNSTMEAMHLVGSVQTSKLTNSTLSVVQPQCATCFTSIRLVAGGDSVSGDVGVLCILPPTTTDGTFLHVEDVHILVVHSNLAAFWSTMKLSATAASGRATVAGIALRHATTVRLSMDGRFAIDITATQTESQLVHGASHTDRHSFRALEQDPLTTVPLIRRTMHDLQEEHSTTRPPTATDMSITATALGEFSTASLGGITLSAFTNNKDETATVITTIENCTLRFNASVRIDTHTVLLVATATERYSATALLGVAVNSFAQYSRSSSMMTINGSSSLTIGRRGVLLLRGGHERHPAHLV